MSSIYLEEEDWREKIRLPVLPSDGRDNETKALEFALFAAMGFTGQVVAGFPVGELAMGLVGLVAMTKRPTRAPSPVLLALIGAVPLWMLAASFVDHHQDLRRVLHLCLWAGLAILLAQGRIHMRTMGRGFAVGLVVALGAGLVGVGAHTEHGGQAYIGRLTGFMGDPNEAGYYVLVLGLVACAYLGKRVHVGLFIAAALPLLALTLSRTSLFALGACALWLMIGHRVSPVIGVLFLGAVVWAFSHFPAQWKHIGPFADRTGTDELRARIDAASNQLVHSAGATGHGPGTSVVDVYHDGNLFFFHNSYAGVINEMGWIGITLVLGLVVVAMVHLTRYPIRYRNGWIEAALISTAVVAINLGEVFLDLPAAIAIGAAAFHTSRPIDDAEEEREHRRWLF